MSVRPLAQEYKEFLKTQPQIRYEYDEEETIPRIEFYRSGYDIYPDHEEKIFFEHVPMKQFKYMLRSKKLLYTPPKEEKPKADKPKDEL